MKHKLIVVRDDGVSHTSDFDGWYAETACFAYFKDVQCDTRTLYAVVLHGHESVFSPRAEWSRTAVQLEKASQGEDNV